MGAGFFSHPAPTISLIYRWMQVKGAEGAGFFALFPIEQYFKTQEVRRPDIPSADITPTDSMDFSDLKDDLLAANKAGKVGAIVKQKCQTRLIRFPFTIL